MGGGVGFTFSLPRSHPAPQTPTIPAPLGHPHHRIRSWPRLRSPHSHPHGSRSVGWQTISELSDVHYHLLILCLKQLSDCSVFIAPPSSISKYSASSLYHRHLGSIECWKGNLIWWQSLWHWHWTAFTNFTMFAHFQFFLFVLWCFSTCAQANFLYFYFNRRFNL